MAWFTRKQPSVSEEQSGEKTVRTEGLWQKCPGCSQVLWRKTLEENLEVCSKCGHHFKISASDRLKLLLDGKWEEHDTNMHSQDPLEFADAKPYKLRLTTMRDKTKLPDAIISATGLMNNRKVHMCCLELKFIGGSMGCVVGEKITRAIERSLADQAPLIVVSASGGARMQEGAVSLMQMAKVSAGLMKLDEAKIPFLSVLTDPTTGGVTASFAMLGDLNIAEPGALIGFAGPRVIEQTIRQKLPAGFQRSEFLLEHGFLDAVVKRGELKNYLAESLDFFRGPV
ncbi:MAG: acetyl-CoA carboxylase carboxyltransferase subunit beta [bacterium]|nr:acetyl-CoA carboxylase carboxyltransferase subunit beta [bacterium]